MSALDAPDIETLRGWIGREERGVDLVTSELARRFHATLRLDGPAPVPGEKAPLLIHLCLAQPAVAADQLGMDGHPAKGGFLPPVPLPRRMWAGGSFRFEGDIFIGDTVERLSRVVDVTEKSGRSGRLFFVTVEHAISANGRVVITERQDIVYREAATGRSLAEGDVAPLGAYRHAVDGSPTLLFRYSALTFNGHRIHYDRPYATEVEHYAGLVVHGPMQATMLLNLATEAGGRRPDRFSFRGQTPLVDGPFWLNAGEAGDGKMQLWTAAAHGPVAMSAEAEWN